MIFKSSTIAQQTLYEFKIFRVNMQQDYYIVVPNSNVVIVVCQLHWDWIARTHFR